jgi:DNA-binding NarL/FixJ family response regulator
VKYHLKHISQKLNARNRTEAVTAAIQAGILKSNDLPEQ